MKAFSLKNRYWILMLAVCLLTLGPSLYADGGANHRGPNTDYGVSGGNINDITKRFCCSGTLGALVQSGGTNYILSNNHVLGRSGQAQVGEDVSQPGRIDNNCATPPIVADFTAAAPLGPSNVDAAIAQLRSGTMNTTGAIEDIGTISSVVKTPSVGLAVAKSGRTTGFTTGTIGAINVSVNVQYQQNCGSGKKFTVAYTNQVVINSSSFSAGGDSGSLIVSNNSCHQPVALLFAGSSSATIANPIGQVLTQLGNALGSPVSFVGGSCTASREIARRDGQSFEPSDDSVGRAVTAMRSRERALMSRPGIIGIGVGASDTNPNEATIVVYVDVTSQASPSIPRRINGVPVRAVFTEPFIAY